MANASQVITAGFARAIVHRLDTDGYAAGLTGSLSNGNDAGSYEMQGLMTADLQVPEPERTDILGNNRLLGAFTWPIGSSPTGNVEAAVFDMDLNVALEGLKKRTLGGLEIETVGAEEADSKNICMIMQSDAVSRTAGYMGLKKKFGLIVPKATATVLGISTLTQRERLSARLSLTIQAADRYPWGESITLANEGANNALAIFFTSDYFVDLHAFKGDGTTTTVVLDHTPAGDHNASPQRVHVYVNGTAKTPGTDFTVNVGTKTVTFQTGAVPPAGAMVEILYEYV